MSLPSPTGGLQALLEGDGRALLEREALPAFLVRQRWFAGKARKLESARIVDATAPGAIGGSAQLVLAEVSYRTGAPDLYLMMLAAAEGVAAGRLEREAPDQVIARLGGSGIVFEALADDGACLALLGAIAEGRTIPTRMGRVVAAPTSEFTTVRGPAGVDLRPRRGSAEQSNSAIHYGNRLILKVFRRLEPGTNPDLELGRFLAERTGFDRIPRPAGSLEYQGPGPAPSTLGILQELVRNQGTGWEYARNELVNFFERVNSSTKPAPFAPGHARTRLDRAMQEPPLAMHEALDAGFKAAATLGLRTAGLHRALASDPVEPAFRPEPLGAADLETIAHEIRSQVETSLATLGSRVGSLDAHAQPMADRVLDGTPRLLGLLDELPTVRADSVRIRCHGDYHLGQVLWTGGDFVILDFEGEPARPLEWRRRKQSPLRDVVGMLRSFDYAASAALFAVAGDPESIERLAPWARAWCDGNSAAFLRSYLATVAGTPLVPSDHGAVEALLAAFLLDKALYELLYELNNRPDWVSIPLRGILSLIESGRAATPRRVE